MEKPKISVRRPPPSVDDFVNGPSAASGQPLAASQSAASGSGIRGVVTRAKGDQRRRFTVYLSPEQGAELERRCFEQRWQLSDAIAQAIGDWLAK